MSNTGNAGSFTDDLMAYFRKQPDEVEEAPEQPEVVDEEPEQYEQPEEVEEEPEQPEEEPEEAPEQYAQPEEVEEEPEQPEEQPEEVEEEPEQPEVVEEAPEQYEQPEEVEEAPEQYEQPDEVEEEPEEQMPDQQQEGGAPIFTDEEANDIYGDTHVENMHVSLARYLTTHEDGRSIADILASIDQSLRLLTEAVATNTGLPNAAGHRGGRPRTSR